MADADIARTSDGIVQSYGEKQVWWFPILGTRAMPRYFIDLQDGGRPYRDEDGQDLRSVEAARDQAIQTLAELMHGVKPSLDERVLTSTVRDDQDQALYRATLSLRCTKLTEG